MVQNKLVIREAVKVTPGEQVIMDRSWWQRRRRRGGVPNHSGIKGENGDLKALGDLLILPEGNGGPPDVEGINGYGIVPLSIMVR